MDQSPNIQKIYSVLLLRLVLLLLCLYYHSGLRGVANATLFLHSMSKPRHGVLQMDDKNEWYFYAGKSTEGTLLPDLSANIHTLLDTGQLFRGHTKFKTVCAYFPESSFKTEST
jgi:hypothetical protein